MTKGEVVGNELVIFDMTSLVRADKMLFLEVLIHAVLKLHCVSKTDPPLNSL